MKEYIEIPEVNKESSSKDSAKTKALSGGKPYRNSYSIP